MEITIYQEPEMLKQIQQKYPDLMKPAGEFAQELNRLLDEKQPPAMVAAIAMWAVLEALLQGIALVESVREKRMN